MRYIIFALLLIFSISCKKQIEDKPILSKEIVAKPTIQGTWRLDYQFAYENNMRSDSATGRVKQIKIFTPTKFMWSSISLTQEREQFAYGSYEVTDSTLVETKEYAAKIMDGHSKVAKCKLILNENNYTQIFVDSVGNPFYAEKFIRVN